MFDDLKYSGRGEWTLRTLVDDLSRVRDTRVHGRVTAIMGMLVEIGGVQAYLSVGDRCDLIGRAGDRVPCEVVGFREGRTLAMSFSSLVGVGLGATAEVLGSDAAVYPHDGWLGRIVNAFGEPLDGAGQLTSGPRRYPIHNAPPPATMRQRVGEKLDLGVRSVNTFLTCCKGQRLGIFSGSGVGKSVLLSMLARYCAADVVVIGLVGERGREVKEFIEEHLGPEGLARSVVVVATSDESALMRRQAAYLTMTVAEHFRDQGRSVLCLIDSITRFAMAQREIGLSAGEPPASKGYTPTVFAELPKLLERAGPGTEKGTITGLFTVLVEGDDHNEPISDAVRGIVDGHVVLDRSIAQRNRYPAINVLQSISRTMPACNTAAQNQLVDKARQVMSVYDDMAELIRLGAYRSGSDPAVDEAVALNGPLEAFLSQAMEERTPLDEGYAMLADILGVPWSTGDKPDADDDSGAAAP